MRKIELIYPLYLDTMDDQLAKIRSSIYRAKKIKQSMTFTNILEKLQDLRDALSNSLQLVIKFMSTRLPPGNYLTLIYMNVLKKYSVDIFDMNERIKLIDDILRILDKIMRELTYYKILPDSDSDDNYSIRSESYSESDRTSDSDFIETNSSSDESDMSIN